MKNFLIIGETCTDVFIYGHCARLSPEAPVPVFIPIEKVVNIGMAHNVMENLNAINKLQNGNIQVNTIFSLSKATKTRYVDSKSNHMFLRVDEGDSEYEELKIDNQVLEKVSNADVILISDYDKGYLTNVNLRKALSVKKSNALVIMDTKKIIDPKLATEINYFKLNSTEFGNNYKENPQLVEKIKNKIIITRGSNGTDYKGKNYHVLVKQTIDVSGAGDTFLAALGYCLGNKNNIVDSIIFANQMASSVVTKRGVTTI